MIFFHDFYIIIFAINDLLRFCNMTFEIFQEDRIRKENSNFIISVDVYKRQDFTCFKRFNNCYILLLNSPQTLENTGFVTGEFSLIVSLVLYRPTSVY